MVSDYNGVAIRRILTHPSAAARRRAPRINAHVVFGRI
jgi:hypothetical protein